MFGSIDRLRVFSRAVLGVCRSRNRQQDGSPAKQLGLPIAHGGYWVRSTLHRVPTARPLVFVWNIPAATVLRLVGNGAVLPGPAARHREVRESISNRSSRSRMGVRRALPYDDARHCALQRPGKPPPSDGSTGGGSRNGRHVFPNKQILTMHCLTECRSPQAIGHLLTARCNS